MVAATSNIKKLINILGFSDSGDNFYKNYENHNNYQISINLKTLKVGYGNKIQQGDKTTSNLEVPESLVVLECVDRLLTKGYRPEDLYLEKKWQLGRSNKGGKADICVKHKKTAKNYLIIECKTWGSEYEKEKKKMTSDVGGGQLFSYYQQELDTQYLCLYTSRANDEIEYKNDIVPIKKEFKGLGTVKEVVGHWDKQFRHNGIFDDYANAYGIQLKKLTRQDLKPLKQEDGKTIYNQFAEILRHNVVSDKGNAFNKLFNLFLCKILDEDKQPSDELDFQWIDGEDDHKKFMGRLNTLYKNGMKKFLDKEITDYIPNDVEGKKARQAIEELRLYKSQEFAFVDVFNKESFEENSAIVKEVVELLQGWQICYTEKQQFLGDFFENLLNSGFKQESGQFFTPVPLVRFIIRCLPIKELILKKLEEGVDDFLPYVIDFACGSGHFLTEIMDVIQKEIDALTLDNLKPRQVRKLKGFQDNVYSWAEDYIYGIEKDYRLVKTTKLACFLYGDGEAHIVHASGLDSFGGDKYLGKLKKQKQFDVLIANPPYSVKGFRSTVKNRDDFTLYSAINDNSSEIEILFIERMAQLLRPGGIAGIILPSSILTNSGAYEKARRLMLEQFVFKAIVLCGGNAFMATGTNTVVLFLVKREPPIKLNSKKDYIDMIKGQKLIVIENTGSIDEERAFLGYKFSKRRGKEGIEKGAGKLLDEQNISNSAYLNSYILSALQGKSVTNETIDENLKPYMQIMDFSECFDWDSDSFDNILYTKKKTVINSPYPLKNLFDVLISLETGSRPKGGISGITGGAISLGGEQIGINGKLNLNTIPYVPISFFQQAKKGIVKDKDILICKDGAPGKACLVDIKLLKKQAMINEHVFIMRANQNIIQQYLFLCLLGTSVQEQIKQLAYNKTGLPGLNQQHLKKIKIPLPPLDKQQEIVTNMKTLEQQETADKNKIEGLRGKVKVIFENTQYKHKKYKISDIVSDLFAGGDLPKNRYSKTKTDNYTIPIYSNSSKNDGIFGYTDIIKVSKPCITISARGTIGFIKARNNPFYPIVRLLVLVPNENIASIKYLEYALNKLNLKQYGVNIPQLTVPQLASFEIELPELKIQNNIIEKVDLLQNEIKGIEENLLDINRKKEQILKSL